MGHSSKAGENIFWAMNRNKPGIIKRILNALEKFIARIRGKDAYLAVEQRQAAERLRDMLTGELKRAYGTDVKGEAAVESGEGKRYSISKSFVKNYDAWDKQSVGGYFKLGTTSAALESVGINPANIYWYKSKIKEIKAKHPEMIDAVIKQVPELLENPVIIMQSQTVTNRATVLGDLDAGGKPVLCALELKPDGNISNFIVIASAYPKSAVQNLINTSDILYVDPNKNRTDSWLSSRGLQLPEGVTNYGSIGSISYTDKNVKGQIVFGEEKNVKTAMQEALEKAGVTKEGKRFSLSSNVEQTKDLIAVHNMTAAELEKSLDLGGLPMPSIAIIKAADGHSEYGDVSLVFGKDTIDPKKSARNKVYGGDAWTPTFPKIDYKANEKVGKRIRDKYYDLSRKYGYDNTRALYNYAQDLSDVLTSEGGEKAMIGKLYGDTGMMQIYLMDTGRERIANVNKETKTALTDGQVRQYENLIDTLGRDEMNGFAKKDGEELSDLVRRRKAFIEENEAGIRKAFEKTFVEDGMSAKDAAEVSAELALSDLRKYVLDTFNYIKNGAETVKTEFDSEATNAAIKKAADGEGYRKWVNDLFGGAEEKSGIRNSKDAYTASGNRRSFEALHWENNLENIVKAMLEQDETGGAFFSGTGIWGVSAKKYNSISEIKNDSSRLRTMNETEYNALKEQYGARMQEIAQTLIDPKNDNYFIASDDAYSLIVDAVRNSKDESGILRYLKKYNSRATEKTASDIAALVRDIAEMPTGYFEAKPQRAVGFDEVKAVILPDNASGELVSRLESDGINTVTYKAGDENSRLEALNGVRDVRFSLTRANDEYMKAVESGNVEEQQRLVDEAAKANGYDRLFWHGSKKGGGFTEFRDWSYFTENKKYASRYAKPGDNSSLYEVYANLGNAFDTRKPECREIFDKMRSEYGLSKVQESGLPDWTDGYDIAEFIDENGLDYDSIILDEGGDLVDGKPVSRGFSYVIRSSEQVKSADPITYDDSGNVIPLTERFDSGNRDIRWSLAGNSGITTEITDDSYDEYEGGYQRRDIKLNGETVGTVAIRIYDDYSEIDRIDIDEKYRNKGIGTTVLGDIAGEFDTTYIVPDNESAKRLYERIGEEVTSGEVYENLDQGYGVYRLDKSYGNTRWSLAGTNEDKAEAAEFSDSGIRYSLRKEDPPKKTLTGYKVFVVKNGKLYPPMVANPDAADTPVGVWLNADIGAQAPDSKTGRKQVKAGGKRTQGRSGSLAFRPGWHLGETPLATQFDRTNPETGKRELFPENFVWAECEIAADKNYQEEAMSYGYTKSGKFQHSLAGLPKLPIDGYYKYRTNPNPDTVPWLITGAMKVTRLLDDAEVNRILESKGLPPKNRVGGNKTLADLGLEETAKRLNGDGNIRYSLSANAAEEIKKALADKNYSSEIKLTDTTPTIMLGHNGVKNLPLMMRATHLRENILTREQAKAKGLPTNPGINYHGLGEPLFLDVIADLDNVKEAYRGTQKSPNSDRRENYFLLISEKIDASGNTINIPVFINETAKYNNVFMDVNKAATVFGREQLRKYINRKLADGSLVRIKRRSIQSSEVSSPIEPHYRKNASSIDNSVSQNDPVVNTQSMQGIEKDSSDERHSLVKSAQSELKALQKENEKLRQDVDDLKQELQLTHGRKLSRDALISSIQKILIDRYGVKLSAKELYPHVTNLYDMFYNNTVDGKRLKKDERVDTMRIIEEMDKIVDAVIENAVGVDDTYVEMKKLLPELRNTKLVVPMDARADAAQSAGFENWAEFRKANFGRVGFANEGLPVDTYYFTATRAMIGSTARNS